MRKSIFGFALLVMATPLSAQSNGFAGLYDFPEEAAAPVVAEPAAETPAPDRSPLADGVPGLSNAYSDAMPSLSSIKKVDDDITREAIEARDRALAALDQTGTRPKPVCIETGSGRQDLKSLDESLQRASRSGLLNRKYQRQMIDLTPDC